MYITDGSLENSCAISLSLFMIVMTSVLTGTMLPFGLAKAGVDPANAGTSVQVSLGFEYSMPLSPIFPANIAPCERALSTVSCESAGSHGHLWRGHYLLHLQLDAESFEPGPSAKLKDYFRTV